MGGPTGGKGSVSMHCKGGRSTAPPFLPSLQAHQLSSSSRRRLPREVRRRTCGREETAALADFTRVPVLLPQPASGRESWKREGPPAAAVSAIRDPAALLPLGPPLPLWRAAFAALRPGKDKAAVVMRAASVPAAVVRARPSHPDPNVGTWAPEQVQTPAFSDFF